MKMTGAQIMVEVLREHQVDIIFGYPGGTALNFFDALYERRDEIKHVLVAHEQGASHMADGYARATGRVGVCCATSGPGATNLTTGIATAFLDSIPMVAITCNVPDSLIGRDAFQEVSITGVTMPISKHNYFVNRIEDLPDALHNAFRIAQSGRKGPVSALCRCQAPPAAACFSVVSVRASDVFVTGPGYWYLSRILFSLVPQYTMRNT